jgi:uncharacterized membrane protein
MHEHEYHALKKLAAAKLGADDADSLRYFADKVQQQATLFKWLAIGVGIIGLLTSIILIGIPLLIVALIMYFSMYRKYSKKAAAFRAHVDNDPDFA